VQNDRGFYRMIHDESGSPRGLATWRAHAATPSAPSTPSGAEAFGPFPYFPAAVGVIARKGVRNTGRVGDARGATTIAVGRVRALCRATPDLVAVIGSMPLKPPPGG